MLELFEAGGFSMFGVVGFGLAALVASALFARRPRLDKLGFIAGMALATGFMSLAGTAMDFAKVLGVAVEAGASGKLPPAEEHFLLLKGLAESISPLIFGFTLLSLIGFTSALGFRRLYRASPPTRANVP